VAEPILYRARAVTPKSRKILRLEVLLKVRVSSWRRISADFVFLHAGKYPSARRNPRYGEKKSRPDRQRGGLVRRIAYHHEMIKIEYRGGESHPPSPATAAAHR
jgi:hypothetical protein